LSVQTSVDSLGRTDFIKKPLRLKKFLLAKGKFKRNLFWGVSWFYGEYGIQTHGPIGKKIFVYSNNNKQRRSEQRGLRRGGGSL